MSFTESFWGSSLNGYAVLSHNMRDAQHACKELLECVHQRTLLEDFYAKGLIKIAKTLSGAVEDVGSIKPSWTLTSSALLFNADAHTKLASELSKLMKKVKELGDFQLRCQKEALNPEISVVVDTLQASQNNVGKAKTVYWKYSQDVDAAEIAIKKGKTKYEKDLKKLKSKQQSAEQEYKTAIAKYSADKRKYEDLMLKTLQTFEQKELDYLREACNTLKAASQNEVAKAEELLKVAQDFSESISQLTPEKQLADFVQQRRTGTERPDEIAFEVYTSNPTGEASLLDERIPDNLPGADLLNVPTGASSASTPSRRASMMSTSSAVFTGKDPFDDGLPQGIEEGGRKGRTSTFSGFTLRKRRKDDGKSSAPDAINSKPSDVSATQKSVDEEGFSEAPDLASEYQSGFQSGNKGGSDDEDDDSMDRRPKIMVKIGELPLPEANGLHRTPSVASAISDIVPPPLPIPGPLLMAPPPTEDESRPRSRSNARQRPRSHISGLKQQSDAGSNGGGDTDSMTSSTSFSNVLQASPSSASFASSSVNVTPPSTAVPSSASTSAPFVADFNCEFPSPPPRPPKPAILTSRGSISSLTSSDSFNEGKSQPKVSGLATSAGTTALTSSPSSSSSSLSSVSTAAAAAAATTPATTAAAAAAETAPIAPLPKASLPNSGVINPSPPQQEQSQQSQQYPQRQQQQQQQQQPVSAAPSLGVFPPPPPTSSSIHRSRTASFAARHNQATSSFSAPSIPSSLLPTPLPPRASVPAPVLPMVSATPLVPVPVDVSASAAPSLLGLSFSENDAGDIPIPVAAALTETVNALFKGTSLSKCIVTGDVMFNFPVSVAAILFAQPSSRLSIKLEGVFETPAIEKMVPNQALIDMSNSNEGELYAFNTLALANYIRSNAVDGFAKVEALKYQIVIDNVSHVPLRLAAHWTCEEKESKVSVFYQTSASLSQPLQDVNVLVIVDGNVLSAQSSPQASWSPETRKLLWQVSSIPAGRGKFDAIFTSTSLCAPSTTAIKFRCERSIISNLNLSFVYELPSAAQSAQKIEIGRTVKRFATGKYLAE